MLKSFQQRFDVTVAEDVDARRACHHLRYQVYCVENPYEDAAAFADGLETDAYDSHAAHILMTDRETGQPIGACRVVLPFDDHGTRRLPLQDAAALGWMESPAVCPPGRAGEISRFCIAKAYRKGRTIGEAKLGLLRTAVRAALDHRLTHVCCVMDPLLLRLFERLGLDFGPIGPLIDHHGLRQPCITSIRDLFDGARAKRRDVWEIVTEDGALCDTVYALEAQIAAAAPKLVPIRRALGATRTAMLHAPACGHPLGALAR